MTIAIATQIIVAFVTNFSYRSVKRLLSPRVCQLTTLSESGIGGILIYSDTELLTMLQEFRRIFRPGGLISIKEYDITAQQMQATTPMLFLHLHEALCRMGEKGHCYCFCTLSLPHWLRKVGLVELRRKPTLIVCSQPLRPVEKKLVGDFLVHYAGKAEQAALPAEELDLWRKLTDLESGDHIIQHPDFQYRQEICNRNLFKKLSRSMLKPKKLFKFSLKKGATM